MHGSLQQPFSRWSAAAVGLGLQRGARCGVGDPVARIPPRADPRMDDDDEEVYEVPAAFVAEYVHFIHGVPIIAL